MKEASFGELEENALGPPDGQFALVGLFGYAAGYLTLDMGQGEDIVNGDGMDFKVVTQGGRYIVFVGDPDQPLKKLGEGRGNQSFDLASVNFFNARYVKIQFLSGADVEIDAVVAINYVTADTDMESPMVSGPDDFEIQEGTSITLNWRTFDATPKNYSILFNEELLDSGSWDGSDITYEFLWSTSGEVHIMLILYDSFGNYVEDSVVIKVLPAPATTSTATSTPSTTSTPVSTSTTPTTAEMNYSVLVLLMGTILALVWRIYILRKC